MKTFLLSLLFLVFGTIISKAQTPTDAGIPESQHVLVVYNQADTISRAVKDYYQNARNIPTDNIFGLYLPDTTITVNGETHIVGLAQETDIIRDFHQDSIWADTPTFHAWRYYLDYVATPIKNWISSHNLSSIRYVCLIKGVPFKIQASGDWSGVDGTNGNLTVDGLLCMLNTENYESFITNEVYPAGGIPNPYFDIDPTLSIEYRFLPDHFTTLYHGYTVKLSYLVSHLDGISYEVVKNMIDKSIDPDMSGTAAWIIDDDPTITIAQSDFLGAKEKLESLDFTVVYDYSNDWLTSYNGDVMGYSSYGTHAEDDNCEWEDSAWVKDSLHFNLSNGSVFNTYESFNGNSLTVLQWGHWNMDQMSTDCPHTQGLATQFTQIGGTGTMGHAWEPGGGFVVQNRIFFPAYAIGYNLIDAIYQGMLSIAHQNVVVGDPLLRVYNCDNTVISTNTTIGSGDYTCDVIVPQNITLTIESGAEINFNRNAALKVYGTLILENEASLNFNKYSKLILEGILIEDSQTNLTFNDHSTYQLNSYHKTENLANYNFNDYAQFLINGELNLNGTDRFNFYDKTLMKVSGRLFMPAGSRIDFSNQNNDYYSMIILGKLICNGDESNIVALNFSNPSVKALYCENIDSLYLNYTIIKEGGLYVLRKTDTTPTKCLSINNSKFINSVQAIYIQLGGYEVENIPNISNCDIYYNLDFQNEVALRLYTIPEIIIGNNSFLYDANHITLMPDETGIDLFNNGDLYISNCLLRNFKYGIKSESVTEPDIDVIETISSDISVMQTVFEKCQNGISVGNQNAPYNGLSIYANHFDSCQTAVYVNDFSDYIPEITANTITGNNNGTSDIGVLLTNGNQAVVSNNSIADYLTGIQVNDVSNPSVINNFISAEYLTVDPLPGIVFNSSGGQIRKNTIQYHLNGVELGGSSPKMAENIITNNQVFGLYVSAGSFPDLGLTASGPITYPLTGYNEINENGCDYEENAEIYFNESGADLDQGCNTIADDRETTESCDYTLLLDGVYDNEIQATVNYWGDHPVYGHDPSQRIGPGILVEYSHYRTSPCTFSPSGSMLVMTTTNGIVIDTVYSSGSAPTEQTDIEERYATANQYYYNHQFTEAKQGYTGIVQNYWNEQASLKAYHKLYSIEKMLGSSPETFQQLKSFYLQKAGEQTDSLMTTALTHLSNLSLVSAGEYETAIDNFDQIVQQNPNTDLALYREIDALTTALLLPEDSTLGKQIAGKYYVRGIDDYRNRVRELLRTRKSGGVENEGNLIPTEYTLYQNYPNPFNPITTIKYDLPKAGNTELIIYDILGRKVTTLVNEVKQPGRYEVIWDASKVASGVYIYQIRTNDFVNVKKMILLK